MKSERNGLGREHLKFTLIKFYLTKFKSTTLSKESLETAGSCQLFQQLLKTLIE